MIRRVLPLFCVALAAGSLHGAALSVRGPDGRLPVAGEGQSATLALKVSAREMSNVAAFEAHVVVCDHLGRDVSHLFRLTGASPAAAWQGFAAQGGTLDKPFGDGFGSMLLPANAAAGGEAELAELTFEYGAGTVGTFVVGLRSSSGLFDAGTSFAMPAGTAESWTAVIGGPGDADGDGCVNVADLLLVRNSLGLAGRKIIRAPLDVNADGVCNVADLLIVRSNLGNGSRCP